ncbi:MAG: CDC27 family protein, partial [Bacteroidota bacterium]
MKQTNASPWQGKTIAVLPFVNMSADAENEYFSDGITEEIINALTRIQELSVTSRTSSFSFKDKHLSTRQIGADLNVSIILEGSVRLAGKKVRITAQLIDVKEDVHFWSETFDRSLDDIFAVQDEVSLLIADRLREHIGHLEIGERLVETPNIPVSAYQQYLQSRYYLLKMRPDSIRTGLNILTDLSRTYPDYAYAYLGLNLGYTLMGTMGFVPAREAFEKGRVHLAKAIQLAPDLPECLLQLSWEALIRHWDFEKAYEYLNKALAIRPFTELYQSMASALVAEGKLQSATQYLDIAFQLDPFSHINHHLRGYVYYLEGKYALAIDFFQQSLSLSANSQVSVLYLGQSLILQGKLDEALAYFVQLSDEENEINQLGGKSLVYAAMGEKEKAMQGIEKLEQLLQTDLMERAMILLILIWTSMGETDKALALFKRGIEHRLPLLIYQPFEPLLQALQKEPEFKVMIDQILRKKSDFIGERRKYKKSLFGPEQLRKLRSQLEEWMQVQRPYLDPALSLRQLAGQINLPANQLSQLLNEGFGQNFSEFVNSYRLETFKTKTSDPALRHLTILALAFESGFNSKTVF